MAITEEQWLEIEQELKGIYGTVKFQLDRIILRICKEFVAENKTGILVYINQEIKFDWGYRTSNNFNPLTETLWRKRSLSYYKPKEKSKIIKDLGKRRAKELYPNLNEAMISFVPYFSTFSTFKRQYKKLDDITVLKIGCKVFNEASKATTEVA